MQNKIKKTVKELAESVLSRTDFFLIDVEIKGGREPVVWVYIDSEREGVNMDQCAEISRELGFLMDAHDLISDRYRLNVSSPGLSRPLSDRRQYPKNKGRKARVKYKTNDKYHKIEGVLKDIDSDKIILEKQDGSVQAVSFNEIVETKIIPSI